MTATKCKSGCVMINIESQMLGPQYKCRNCGRCISFCEGKVKEWKSVMSTDPEVPSEVHLTEDKKTMKYFMESMTQEEYDALIKQKGWRLKKTMPNKIRHELPVQMTEEDLDEAEERFGYEEKLQAVARQSSHSADLQPDHLIADLKAESFEQHLAALLGKEWLSSDQFERKMCLGKFITRLEDMHKEMWPWKLWVDEEQYFGPEFKGQSGYHWINEDGTLNDVELPKNDKG